MSSLVRSGVGAGSGSLPKTKMNLRSSAVKRIMQEASELADPSEDDFIAAPLENDIFEWHCTMRGVKDSEYEGGVYHLRILLPPTYPMSAPDIILLTPNGRFELGKKICIDGLTSFHAGSWQPAWGVRTAVLGLRSFWMQGGEAMSAIGALDYSKEERRRLAGSSLEWECPECGKMKDQIPEKATPQDHTHSTEDPSNSDATSSTAGTESKAPPSQSRANDRSEALGDQTGSTSIPIPIPDVEGPSPPDPISEVPATEPSMDTVTLPSPNEAIPPVAVPLPVAVPVAVPLGSAAPTMTQLASRRATQQQRQAPIWIDALIIAGIGVLVALLYRKISTPSNLIETVSL